jgi:apolipoprotein D and lipocalin family protein
MPRLIIVLFTMLAACAPRGIADSGVYRAAGSPIYSNATFDTGRLNGNWDQVAAFAGPAQIGCRPGGAEFSTVQVSYLLCLSGQDVRGAGQVATTGPGRFSINGKDGIGQDWWVLWVDEGYRTMAIGNPSGTFGFILNRGKDLPADRLKAATEVFDFNGYDIEKLVVFRR